MATSLGRRQCLNSPKGMRTTILPLPRESLAQEIRCAYFCANPVQLGMSGGNMPETILVVDDEENLRKLVTHFLEREGYRVLGALDALDAIRIVEHEVPDLIILDVSMPDMSGFQLAAMLREHPTTRRSPVLFLSARKEIEDKLLAFTLGAVDYIQKPFDGEELAARVNAHLRERREEKEEQESVRIETVSQLMITLGHYINNSLMAMLGHAQITQSDNPNQVEEFRRSVVRSCERIRTVVELLREMVERKELATTNYVGINYTMFDIQKELDRRMEEVNKNLNGEKGESAD
jgi:CheY-like chemotaxis protein